MHKTTKFKKGDKLFYVPVGLWGRGLQKMSVAVLLETPICSWVTVNLKTGGGIKVVNSWCLFKTQLEAVERIKAIEESILNRTLRTLAHLVESRDITNLYYAQLTEKKPSKAKKVKPKVDSPLKKAYDVLLPENTGKKK